MYSAEFWRLLSEYDQIAVESVTPHLRSLLVTLLSKYFSFDIITFSFYNFYSLHTNKKQQNTNRFSMKYSQDELTEIGSIAEDAHIPDNLSSYNTVYGIGQQDDDDEDNQGWNLRRCSSQGLDYICRPFNKGFFEEFMPLVQAGLQSTDWIVIGTFFFFSISLIFFALVISFHSFFFILKFLMHHLIFY